MKQQFKIQPAALDFSIFWGGIVTGLCAALIFQMEIVGYGPITPLAALLFIATVTLAVFQLARTRLVITKEALRLERMLPSNVIVVPLKDVKAVRSSGRTIKLDTAHFGTVSFLRFGKTKPLLDAIDSAVKNAKGETA